MPPAHLLKLPNKTGDETPRTRSTASRHFATPSPIIGQAGNALGQSITDALRTDTRNMTAGAILLTQPLYMGGKIKAYERITRAQEQLAAERTACHPAATRA